MPQRKNQITIDFDKKVYDRLAIKNTIQAYEGLAKFNLKTNKKSFKLEATDIDKDINDVFEDEFCNYVLSETKKFKSLCL